MIATSQRAHLIANSNSGIGKGAALADEAQKICEELKVELIHYDIKLSADFDRQSKAAVENAQKDGGV